MDLYGFEQKIKAYIKQSGRSQAATARKLGVAPETFNEWVRGVKRMPREVLHAFCELQRLDESQRAELFELAGYVGPPVEANVDPAGVNPEPTPATKQVQIAAGSYIAQTGQGPATINIGPVTIQVTPIETAQGRPLPQQNLSALRQTLRQALPHLDAAQQAATQAAIEHLEQQLAALPQHEQAYRERVKARFAADAPYYVPLTGQTTEAVSATQAGAARLSRRRRQRALAEYHEWIPRGQEIKRVKLKTLRAGVDKYPCIVLLGEPGSGKTTALQHLAYDLAREPERLPLLLRLSEFEAGLPVETFILQGWAGSVDADHWGAPELAANLDGYLEAGHFFFLLDALNEMPREQYRARTQALRQFVDRWSAKGNRFVVTCRVLDYGEELSGLQRIEIQPLSDEQIRIFLQKELPAQWAALWRLISTGASDQRRLLEMARNPYILTVMIDVYAEEGRLGRNPAELMSRFTQILLNRDKSKYRPEAWLDVDVQQAALAVMAFETQIRADFGTRVKTEQVKAVMPAQVQPDPRWPPVPAPPDQVLKLAAGANIIEMPVDHSSVRFYHQLLQEYFATRALLRQVHHADRSGQDLSGFGNLTGLDLDKLWRWPWLEAEMPAVGERRDWDPLPLPPPTNWEETTILAAGLAAENDDHLVRALIEVNPVLAGRCLHEGPAKVDAATRQAVIEALLATIARSEVALRVRIAAGNVLGQLGDPRLGEYIAIPPGKFVMGDEYDGPQHTVNLPYGYLIGQYPLTRAEFAGFIEDGGYRERRWWTKTGWQEKEKGNWTEPDYWTDSRFNRPNQPVVGISWYECVAFCRWQTEQFAASGQLSAFRDQLAAVSGQPVKGVVVRLATEAEWEKAARGTDGRIYPWGDEFEPARVNMRLGEQQVNATTPVGIYPGGRSPYGLYDCAGNVWEWGATAAPDYEFKKYPYKIEDEWSEDYLNRTDVRVLRGAVWSSNLGLLRPLRRPQQEPQ